MNKLSCTIRNYRPDDFNNYVELHVETEQREPSRNSISPHALAECLGRPNYSPEKDLFLAEMDGKIIGYISVAPELGIGRALLNCLVHPRNRRKGTATKLFPRAIRHAKEMGARVVHMSIPEANDAAKGLMSRLGFRCVRRFLELNLNMYNRHLPDVNGGAFTIRGLRHNEEDKLTELQNRSFIGTWGFNPNTTEEIIYRVNLRGCSPKDVIMLFSGDTPLGYCWTTVQFNSQRGESKGKIHMLGVDPDYRMRGIGKEVLLGGLSHLKSKGIEVVELTVDSENQAACSLYESFGFEICSTTVWYEKVID